MNKYCILPFISVRVEDSTNNGSMQFRPCCLYKPETPIKFNNVQEYLDSDFLKNLQQHLLTKPDLPAGCHNCTIIEEKNLISVRKHNFQYFNKTTLTSTDIKQLDIFLSNTCNLTCIMCKPKFSSAIGAEQTKLGIIHNQVNFDITDLACDTLSSLPNVEYINVAGGEFFYSKHCTKVLELIAEQKNTKVVQIITNGTVCKPDHIALLQQIPNLNLRISLDGTGTTYDFVRYPASWQEVSNNVIKFKNQLPNAKIETLTVMMPMTIFDIFKLFDFCNTNDINLEPQELGGEPFGWQMLTPDEKTTVTDFIIKNINEHHLTSKQKVIVLNYAKTVIPKIPYDPAQRSKSIEKIASLCRIRKQNIDHLFLEFPALRAELLNAVNQ